jgi:multiple sugar transport system substrate-binding protein
MSSIGRNNMGNITKFIGRSALGAVTGLAGLLALNASGKAAGEYDGVTINILTRPGPVIAQRMVERGKEFTAATGAKIKVVEVPFAE